MVTSQCLVTIDFNNNFELSAWCDILQIKVANIVCLEDHGFLMKGSNMMDMRKITHLYIMGVRRSFVQTMKLNHLNNRKKN